MNEAKREYIEEFGVFFEQLGGAGMLGRVLAALLISEPPELTAEDLSKDFIEGLSVRETVEAVLNMWPLCLFFGALAMLFSALFHRRVFATAISGAALVAMYFINALGNTVEDLEDAQPYTVFHYYGSAIENGMDWMNFAGISGCALALLVFAVIAFGRRDIYT